MDKVIFQDVPIEKREQYVRDNCDDILEGHEYKRQFSTEEVDEMKTDLTDVLIGIDILEEKFETLKIEHKAQTKPMKDKLRKLAVGLREGAERVKGTAYAFRDLNSGEYGIYSPEGILISVPRKLKPAEKQKTIQMVMREGTGN